MGRFSRRKDYENLYEPCRGVYVDTEAYSGVYIADGRGEIVSWTYDEVKEDPSAWTAAINAAVYVSRYGPAALRRKMERTRNKFEKLSRSTNRRVDEVK